MVLIITILVFIVSSRITLCVQNNDTTATRTFKLNLQPKDSELRSNIEHSSIETPPGLQPLDILFIVLNVLLLFLILVGSLKPSFEPLRGFSIVQNLRDLFKTGGGRIECLDGLRFISLTWVMICHTTESVLKINPRTEDMKHWIEAQAIVNGFPSVDTFFLLSGFLVSLLTLKELDKRDGKLNYFVILLHRYVRLTGVYAYIILFHASLYKYMNPVEAAKCARKGWINLTYLGNFLVGQGGLDCVSVSWYLDSDMQMFAVSWLMIYCMWRRPIGGLIPPLIAGILSGLYLIGLRVYFWNDWGYGPIDSPPIIFITDYMNPLSRYHPYLIGMLLGYFIHFKGKIQLSSLTVNGLWTLASFAGLAVVYGPVLGSNSNPEHFAYGVFYRIAWASSVAWVIWASEYGYGNSVNALLSWKYFKVPARLSFLMYLIHYSFVNWLVLVLQPYLEGLRIPIALTLIGTITLIVSGIVSLLLHVLVELPLTKTEKYFFAKLH